MISPINPSTNNGVGQTAGNGSDSAKGSDKTQRINALREQIRNGSYTVDFEGLATAIVNSGEVSR